MIHVGPLDECPPRPDPLRDEPIHLREVLPADEPGKLVLLFEGARDGALGTRARYIADSPTAAEIERYCRDCDSRGAPYYWENIIQNWGLQNSN